MLRIAGIGIKSISLHYDNSLYQACHGTFSLHKSHKAVVHAFALLCDLYANKSPEPIKIPYTTYILLLILLILVFHKWKTMCPYNFFNVVFCNNDRKKYVSTLPYLFHRSPPINKINIFMVCGIILP